MSLSIPVSYTHLDVYKRQVLGMGCRRGVSTAAVEEAARQMLSGSGFDERAVDVYKRQLSGCEGQGAAGA